MSSLYIDGVHLNTNKKKLLKNAYKNKNSKNILKTIIYNILKRRKELDINEVVNSQKNVRPIKLKETSK